MSVSHACTVCQHVSLYYNVLREYWSRYWLFEQPVCHGGAAEFTLGGQGPLLFAWVQRERLGNPPTRIH